MNTQRKSTQMMTLIESITVSRITALLGIETKGRVVFGPFANYLYPCGGTHEKGFTEGADMTASEGILCPLEAFLLFHEAELIRIYWKRRFVMEEKFHHLKLTFGAKAIAFVVAFFILTTQTSAITVQPQVAPGASHTVGLKFDGTVVAVGTNGPGQCDVSNWTLGARSGRAEINGTWSSEIWYWNRIPQ